MFLKAKGGIRDIGVTGIQTCALPIFALGEVPDDAAARFAALLDQRAQRVPLQHLTGRAPFRHLELAVGPGVFVPRPETEQRVEWALAQLAGADEPVVVDLGSGSGAIALSGRKSDV